MTGLVNLISRLKISIRAKVLTGYLFVVALLVAGTILGLSTTNYMYSKAQDISKSYNATNELMAVDMAFYYEAVQMGRVIRDFDPAQLQQVETTNKYVSDWLTKAISSANDRDRPNLTLIQKYYTDIRTDWDNILALRRAGKKDDAANVFYDQQYPLYSKVDMVFQQMIGDQDKRVSDTVKSADQANDFARMIILIPAVIVISLALFFGLVMTRAITTPLRKITDHLKLIASGDLSENVEVTNRDEMGELAAAANQMRADLRAIVDAIKEEGGLITSSSAEILSSSEQQAGGAAEEAAAVGQVTATIEQLSHAAVQIK